jgi:glycosyltransferase involved in cell wall biosynthesis
MHIVIDARVISSSTGTFVERLLENLQAVDAENRYTVILDRKDADFWRPRATNFAVEHVHAPAHSWAEQIEMLRVLNRLRPDLVHFCMPQQPLLYRGATVTMFHDLTILRIRNERRHPLVSLTKRGVGWASFRIIAATSDRLIVPSQFTKRDVAASLGVPEDKVRVIYEAADANPAETSPYPHGFGRFLLYVGRHSPYKNVNRLCDAHQQLLATHPDLGLVLVGKLDEDARRTQAYCEANGYRNVHFTGFLPAAQRDWLYQQAAVYVFPSLAEGFGLPGLEAMGYGAPVASSRATCLPEIYGDAAAYFDPEDVAAMAGAIGGPLDDEDRRTDLVRRGHERFAQFSWRRMAEETLEEYRRAVEARASRRR